MLTGARFSEGGVRAWSPQRTVQVTTVFQGGGRRKNESSGLDSEYTSVLRGTLSKGQGGWHPECPENITRERGAGWSLGLTWKQPELLKEDCARGRLCVVLI